jgi:hypothetical protein
MPLELLHKIEARVARVVAGRATSMVRDPETGKECPRHPRDSEIYSKYPATVSGLTRRALKNVFEFEEDPREFIFEHALEVLIDEVRGWLAAAVYDNKSRGVIKRIVDKQEPDFG